MEYRIPLFKRPALHRPVKNTIYTQIGYPLRKEREMIHGHAMREAVINAIVHNDYSNGACPKFEFFSDRLEITSAGGLPYGVSEDDFFNGYSSPRNKEIMRVFRDLEIVEQLGSGVPRILEHYGRDAFEIRPNFLRVIFRYEGSVKTSVKILEAMRLNNEITIPELAELTGVTTRSIERNIQKLQDAGLLLRVGPDKGGYWDVLDQ